MNEYNDVDSMLAKLTALQIGSEVYDEDGLNEADLSDDERKLLVDRTTQSLILLKTFDGRIVGTGFVVTTKGHVITNYQILQNEQSFANGSIFGCTNTSPESFKLELVASLQEIDIAIMRLPALALPICPLRPQVPTIGRYTIVQGFTLNNLPGYFLPVNSNGHVKRIDFHCGSLTSKYFGCPGSPVLSANGSYFGVVYPTKPSENNSSKFVNVDVIYCMLKARSLQIDLIYD